MNIMSINENGFCFILLLLLSISNLLFVSEPANNCQDASDLKTNTSRSVSLVSRIFNSSLCILHFFVLMPFLPLNPSNTQLLKINTRCRNKSHPSFVCQSPPTLNGNGRYGGISYKGWSFLCILVRWVIQSIRGGLRFGVR